MPDFCKSSRAGSSQLHQPEKFETAPGTADGVGSGLVGQAELVAQPADGQGFLQRVQVFSRWMFS